MVRTSWSVGNYNLAVAKPEQAQPLIGRREG